MRQTVKKQSSIELLQNGNHRVHITFDITQHGHTLSLPRNYNLQKVRELLLGKQTQEFIKQGYAIGYYTHRAREISKSGVVPDAVYPNGEFIEPLTKVVTMDIKGNLISYSLDIINSPLGKKVVDALSGGFGGFSFAWDINKQLFGGVDYVLHPNFNGNRLRETAYCDDEKCVMTHLDSLSPDNSVISDLLKYDPYAQEAIYIEGLVKGNSRSTNTIALLLETLDTKSREIDELSERLTYKDGLVTSYKRRLKTLESDAIASAKVNKTLFKSSVASTPDTIRLIDKKNVLELRF